MRALWVAVVGLVAVQVVAHGEADVVQAPPPSPSFIGVSSPSEGLPGREEPTDSRKAGGLWQADFAALSSVTCRPRCALWKFDSAAAALA